MGALIDLTGKQFGRLTIVSLYPDKKSPNGDRYWNYRCSCGRTGIVNGRSVRHGLQTSCGCGRLDYLHNQHNQRTHGGSGERLYRVWRGMIDRCYYPSHNRYPNYGGRGITVCEEWRHNYSEFREWAFSHGYAPEAPRGKCTIDRIDVDGNYEPSNCRWVDMKTQEQNKRRNNKHATD